jgi:hypothetical protein
MTTGDPDKTLQPTDPEDVDPTRPDDTEGHSMLQYELGRQVARDHAVDADKIARDAARAREVKKPRSFLGRLRGR